MNIENCVYFEGDVFGGFIDNVSFIQLFEKGIEDSDEGSSSNINIFLCSPHFRDEAIKGLRSLGSHQNFQGVFHKEILYVYESLQDIVSCSHIEFQRQS